MKNVIEDNFFCYSCNDLDKIENHLYGYAIKDGKSYKNCKVDENIVFEDTIGVYIHVKRTGDSILFFADSLCSIPIYYFVREGYWALSNSFWMLCDEVIRKYPLSINEGYAIQLVNRILTPFSKNTLSKEIQAVPYGAYLRISLRGKTELQIVRQTDSFYSIPLDSLETLAVIDNWVNKWKGIIRGLYQTKGVHIEFDLSGGFDSRMSFALALAAGINLNSDNVTVCSNFPSGKMGSLYFEDDYRVAMELGEKYGFELNKNACKVSEISSQSQYSLFKNVYLCNHDQAYFYKGQYDEPLFNIGGQHGENLRGYIDNMDIWLGAINRDRAAALAMEDQMDLFDYLSSDNMQYAMSKGYLYTWSKYHHGLERFWNMMFKKYQLAPCGDTVLYRIDWNQFGDKQLLLALILERSCPELLEVRLANGEVFKETTIQTAKKISKRKAMDVATGEYPELDVDALRINNNWNIPKNVKYRKCSAPNEMIELDFHNKEGRARLIGKFGVAGWNMWEEAARRYDSENEFHSEANLVPITAIMEMLKYEFNASRWFDKESYLAAENGIIQELSEKHPESAIISTYRDELAQQIKLFESRRIAIYGAGNNGRKWIKELQQDDRHEIVGVYDRNYKSIRVVNGIFVDSPEKIRNEMFDCIVVAIEDEDVKNGIKEMLIKRGVLEGKII